MIIGCDKFKELFALIFLIIEQRFLEKNFNFFDNTQNLKECKKN